MSAAIRIVLICGAVGCVGADWPGFRGPGGSGASPDSTLPVRWGPEENVAWKVRLPGPGFACPIVTENRVLVVCYSGYGTAKGQAGEVKGLLRHLLCLDRHTGKLLWQKDLPARLPERAFTGPITQHGYATSTPATDGEIVVVFLGRSGVAAFDLKGNELWQVEVGTGLNSWGSGASPVIDGDRVFVNASVESNALVALDRKTGKELWRTKAIGDCWSTPVLVDVPGGQRELVLNTAGLLLGFDPASGNRLWQCEGIEATTASSSPVARNGTIYAMGAGVDGKKILAVRAGGRGDVTKTHILWEQKAGASHTSPVLAGDYLFFVTGQVVCLRADTGAIVFQERLFEGQNQFGSPVVADGKLCVFSRRSGAFVVPATGKFEVLARNDLGDPSDFNASPAVSDGQLFIRSHQYLYCIGKK